MTVHYEKRYERSYEQLHMKQTKLIMLDGVNKINKEQLHMIWTWNWTMPDSDSATFLEWKNYILLE